MKKPKQKHEPSGSVRLEKGALKAAKKQASMSAKWNVLAYGPIAVKNPNALQLAERLQICREIADAKLRQSTAAELMGAFTDALSTGNVSFIQDLVTSIRAVSKFEDSVSKRRPFIHAGLLYKYPQPKSGRWSPPTAEDIVSFAADNGVELEETRALEIARELGIAVSKRKAGTKVQPL